MLFESLEDFISEINEIILVDSSSNENLEFDLSNLGVSGETLSYNSKTIF